MSTFRDYVILPSTVKESAPGLLKLQKGERKTFHSHSDLHFIRDTPLPQDELGTKIWWEEHFLLHWSNLELDKSLNEFI